MAFVLRLMLFCLFALPSAFAGSIPMGQWTTGWEAPGNAINVGKWWISTYQPYWIPVRSWVSETGTDGQGNGMEKATFDTCTQQYPKFDLAKRICYDVLECAEGFHEVNGECKPKGCKDGWHEEGGRCVPDKCPPETERDPVTGLCVKPPDCPNPGEVRVNGQCQKSKCPKSGTLAGHGWEMSGESDEFLCESQGWGTSASGGAGGTGALYCLVRVRNNSTITGDGVIFYYGTARYTGAECQPSDNGGNGTKPGDNGGNNGGSGPGGGDGGTGGGTGPGGGTTGGGNGGGGAGPTPTKPNPSQPTIPEPPSQPPDSDGKCPAGYTKKNGKCYAPTPPPSDPDGDGKCPNGTVKIGSKCVTPAPSGPDDSSGGDGNSTGTGTGGNGNGGGGGNGEGGGQFGGSCKAGFACKGDAIQCAMAREQFMRNCQAFDNSSPESQLYEKSKGKDGDVTKDLPGNSTLDVGSALSRDSLIGGGSCMPDLTLTVMSQAVHVPFSQYCDYFRYMGYILVAFSLLVAVRIVGSGG